jgi:hypothetical protein
MIALYFTRRSFMRRIALALLFFLTFAPPALAADQSASGTSSTEATIFPPADCSNPGIIFMSWVVGDTATRCKSAIDVFDLALANCADGQTLVKQGNTVVCSEAATTPTALASGIITTQNLTDKTDGFTLLVPGLVSANGYSWLANLPADPNNCSLHYVIEIDGQACSMAGDVANQIGQACGNNFMVATSCTLLLPAGKHTITSLASGYNGGMNLNGSTSQAVLNYLVAPMNPPVH